MKQLFKKISAISMAFVVLFSTMSFTFSEHYCGDHLVDSALFSKAQSCGMEMETATYDSDCNTIKKDCCSDVVTHIEGQQDLKIDFTSLPFNQQIVYTAFVYSYVSLFSENTSEKTSFTHYLPPLVDKDIAVLYQVFII